MPKITRPLKAGLGAKPPSSFASGNAAPVKSSPKFRPWASCTPAEEVAGVLLLEFFGERVDGVRYEVWSANKEGETEVVFGLDELLPRELWLKLLSHSLLGYFDIDEEACLEFFDGEDIVILSWGETYEDEDEQGAWMTVYAGETFVGYERYEDFFEGWEGASLRWLVPYLGITPAKLRSTLKRVMPEEG
jgi:hypothetical protein